MQRGEHRGHRSVREQVLAKVEQGTRPLRLNEAAAIARELEVSVDALLAGRTADKARIVIEGIEDVHALCNHIDRLGQLLLEAQEALESELDYTDVFEDTAVMSDQLIESATRAIYMRPQPLPDPQRRATSDIEPQNGGPVGVNEDGPF